MDAFKTSSDVLFILLGAIMVLAMHAGFAFLEVGTVRKKNQVNALVKILVDFSVSTLAYFFVGYGVAYGVSFFADATALTQNAGYDLVKFFFLLTFAAAIPAIVSGGIAERARFVPQLIATAVIVGVLYPLFEGVVWNNNFGLQPMIQAQFGQPFTILPAAWWCMPLAAGWRWRQSCCWGRATDATTATAGWQRIRPRRSRFWPWVRGFSQWVGSALM